jgi:hypothetical protein
MYIKMAENKISVDIHFIKNNDFKTVLATGAFGGISPNGLINMNIFTERTPIPNKISYQIDSKNPALDSSNETGTEGKAGIIREVQFGMLIDIQTAKNISAWLNSQISQLDQLTKK